GAANGQLAWLEPTGHRASYLCGIHDGGNTDASLLAYESATDTVSSTPFASLNSLAPALWVVSWVSPGVVSISPQSAPSTPPAFLTVDASGAWQMVATRTNLNVSP